MKLLLRLAGLLRVEDLRVRPDPRPQRSAAALVVPVTARRVLVLPMIVLAAGAFDSIIGRDLGGIALDLLGGVQPEVAALWPLLLGAVAMLDTMLVVAPRTIADPGASGVTWTVRFLFLLGIVLLAASLAFADRAASGGRVRSPGTPP